MRSKGLPQILRCAQHDMSRGLFHGKAILPAHLARFSTLKSHMKGTVAMTPTSERTLEEKLAAIAAHFDLGKVQSYERAPGTNDNYFVTTEQGDYLFKLIVNTTLEDILQGLPFLQRLQEHAYSATAYYLTSSSGEPFYHSPDCDAVVLPRLPGSMADLSPAVCHEVGIALAQLHMVPYDNLPQKRHWLDARYLPEAIEAAVKMHGAEQLHETLSVFRSLASFQPATFPPSIIHGDLDTTNCLFAGEQLVAFVDWQEIGVSAALMDFAQTVIGFCFVNQDEDSDYWALFDPELYRALYGGYTSVRPFSQYEREHLNDALKYVGLTQPVWSMLMWEHYHPGEQMVETNLLYWKFGLDKLTLPVF